MQVPLFGIGQQGKSPAVTSQRRLNLYYEFQPEADRTLVSVHHTPGLELFVDLGESPIRGLYPKGNLLYAVHRGTFYEINNAGVATSRGSLNTTEGHVDITDNGTQLMLVDGTDGYTYTISTTTLAKITDTDFDSLSSPITVDYQDTYFIASFDGLGSFYISAQNDGTSWDSTDFSTAEYDPDNLVRVFTDHGELILFGEISTEFWANIGATDFPFARINGSQIEWGLAARWSPAKFDNSIIYLAKNRLGEVVVVRLNSYQPIRVSNHELEDLINNYTSISDAVGFSYMLGGHPMYQLNFPTQGKSWLYDGSTNLWTELKSRDITRHRSQHYAFFNRNNYVGDYSNGKIYKLKQDVYTDNGDSIQRQLRGKHVFVDDNRFTVDSLQLLMEQGVGETTGDGEDPQAVLRISKDYGHTWGNERWSDIGKIGKYKTRTKWRRLGLQRDAVYEITISDPIPVHITGANLNLRPGAS